MKTILITTLGCLLMMTLTSCHTGHRAAFEQSPRLFRMNIGTEPPTLDPAQSNDLVSMTVIQNILRGLTQYDANGTVGPAYAQAWEKSADGRHYVFHLRHNGMWSDGQPVTASDFVYAWRRVLDPKIASSYAFLLFDIHNAQAYYEGKLKDPAQLGFKAVNANTLRVDLDRPVAFFLQIMAFSVSMPVRSDNVARYPDTFTEAGHYITNGPYTLAHWDHENEIILKPNPRYWAGAPQNDGVQMVMIPEPNTSLMMYENNELDFVETTTSLPSKEVRRLKTRPDYHHQMLSAISYFGFNTQKKPFNDVRVRRAFAESFDRNYIPEIFQSGEQPITSWISPGLFAYTPHVGLGFNLTDALKNLAEAGYPNGKGFPPVEMLFASTTPENRQMAEIAQYQWQHNLNVPLQLRNVEWKVFLKQLDQSPPQLFRLQWFVDYPDPDSFMNVFISQSGNSHIAWKNPQYDALVHAAAVEQSPHKRFELYTQAQKLLLEKDVCIIPLYVLPKSYLLKPNVEGFVLNTLNVITLDKVRWKK